MGFLGVTVLTYPKISGTSSKDLLIGILCGLMAAVWISITFIQIRKLTKIGENPITIIFYFTLITTIISAILLINQWVSPTLVDLCCLIGVGVCATMYQVFMTMSLKHENATTLAPYEYLTIVWATVIGIFLLNETPDITFLIAIPLIICGAIIATPKLKEQG